MLALSSFDSRRISRRRLSDCELLPACHHVLVPHGFPGHQQGSAGPNRFIQARARQPALSIQRCQVTLGFSCRRSSLSLIRRSASSYMLVRQAAAKLDSARPLLSPLSSTWALNALRKRALRSCPDRSDSRKRSGTPSLMRGEKKARPYHGQVSHNPVFVSVAQIGPTVCIDRAL